MIYTFVDVCDGVFLLLCNNNVFSTTVFLCGCGCLCRSVVFFVELVVSPDMTCDRFSDIVVCVCVALMLVENVRDVR